MTFFFAWGFGSVDVFMFMFRCLNCILQYFLMDCDILNFRVILSSNSLLNTLKVEIFYSDQKSWFASYYVLFKIY